MFLNKQQVTEEIKREIKKFLDANDKTMKTWQLLIAMQSYLKKQEKYRIDNLTLHLKQLEKEEPKKHTKISRRKEIIKIWAEINEKQMKETIVKIKKLKAGSLRRQKKWQTFSQTHPEKERRIKSTKLEMKK